MKRDELVTVGDLERFREDLLVAIRNLLRQPHSTEQKNGSNLQRSKKYVACPYPQASFTPCGTTVRSPLPGLAATSTMSIQISCK